MRQRASRVSVLPPPFEPGWRQFAVSDRMLDVLVPEVSLQRPRILSGIGQGKSTGVPQHVRVCLDLEPGGFRGSIDQLLEVRHRHRTAPLGHEQEGRLAFGLAVQPA